MEENCEREYYSLHVPDDATIVQLVLQAARSVGASVTTVAIGGGSDANVFNRRGMQCVNLGTGMRDIHTLQEWVDLRDFYQSADTVLAAVRARAAG